MTYQIASGHNNAAGLVDITSITPSGSSAFTAPQAYGSYRPGVQRVRADGAVYETGFAEAVWAFGVLFGAQYDYLYTTFAADATNGNAVTIATRNRNGDFANFNARIILPPRAELDYRADPRNPFLTVDVRFARLEAL